MFDDIINAVLNNPDDDFVVVLIVMVVAFFAILVARACEVLHVLTITSLR